MSDTQIESSVSEPSAVAAKPNAMRQFREKLVLFLHRQAERMDLLPAEFGDKEPVDANDANSVLREWLRQARLWADYSPEQVLALKVGAAVLGAALVVLIVLIGAIGA
jgi:hypothetical protein